MCANIKRQCKQEICNNNQYAALIMPVSVCIQMHLKLNDNNVYERILTNNLLHIPFDSWIGANHVDDTFFCMPM